MKAHYNRPFHRGISQRASYGLPELRSAGLSAWHWQPPTQRTPAERLLLRPSKHQRAACNFASCWSPRLYPWRPVMSPVQICLVGTISEDRPDPDRQACPPRRRPRQFVMGAEHGSDGPRIHGQKIRNFIMQKLYTTNQRKLWLM